MTDDRFIRLPEVLQRTGLSRVTIWRRIREGHFPASVRLGPNSVAWRESDFLAWMADPASWARIAGRASHTLSTAHPNKCRIDQFGGAA